MPQSRRFLTSPSTEDCRRARVGRHHRHQMLGHRAHRTPSSRTRAPSHWRVDHQSVRALDPVPHPAALGQDHRAARHGGVDMQPDSVSRAMSAIGPIGSMRRRRRRADGGDDGEGRSPLARSSATISAERVGAHRVFGVERTSRKLSRPKPASSAPLLERAMRMRRHVDARRAGLALQAAPRQRYNSSPARGRK